MSKIKIKVNLNKDKKEIINKELIGILIDNTVKYQYDNTINIIDLDKLILTRKTKEYNLILDFKTQNIIYKYNGCELSMKIKVNKIEKKIKNY